VIKSGGGYKAIGGMTRITIRIGRNMVKFCIFTDGKYAIMTRIAGFRPYLVRGMVKLRRYEPCRLMAYIAIVIGWYMVVMFPYCGITIMTIDTATAYTLVIKLSTCKRLGVMAHRAILGCGDMGGACGVNTGRRIRIMAARPCTIINIAIVIERRR
jgi:hypothetical protein